jgi:drug/metabolite transporter (DMT)-like permease
MSSTTEDLPPRIPLTPRVDAATLALLALPPLFWAGNAVVGRFAHGVIAPMMLNASRWTIAGLLLAPFVARDWVAHRATIRAAWPVLLALGILGMGSYNALQYLALTTSTATNATLIAASTPVFALFFGVLFFSEPIGRRRAVGAAVSIVGVLVVLLHGDVARLATLTFVPGDLFMLGSAATWSLYTWVLRTRRPDLPPALLLAAQIALSAPFVIGCAVVERFGFGVTSNFDTPVAWGALAYVGVMPSIVAYLLWDRGVKRAGATLPMFFINLTPLYGALLSALLLGESPQWYHAVGLVFILAGIEAARRRD